MSSSITSITPALDVPPITLSSGHAGGTSGTLAADENAAEDAHAAATKAAAQLASDQQTKAAAATIGAAEQAVESADAAVLTADAKVQADQSSSDHLNVTA
jgi:hypothetical protein